MMQYYDAVVIGGGVLGCFTARNLRRWNISALLIEKESDVCTGITRANTAIVYAGYDNKPGSLKAEMTVRANANFAELCNALEVPFQRCGSLMVSTGPKGDAVLQQKLEQGNQNGVPGLKLLSAAEAVALEPALTSKISCALYAPSTGTVNPWQLGIAAFENAVQNGCAVRLNSKVQGIKRENGYYIIKTAVEEIACRVILNCAGLQADAVQELLVSPSIRIFPDAGDYIILDKGVEGPKHIIFHEPEAHGKGLTAVPTVEGSLLLGPTKRSCSTEAYAVECSGIDFLQRAAAMLLPKVDMGLQIRTFGAMRPNPHYVTLQNGRYVPERRSIGSFVIENPVGGFYSLIGIKTPGLTCAEELGSYLAEQAANYLGAEKNEQFVPHRPAIRQARRLEEQDRTALIAQDAAYGEVICQCEDVTRAEVVTAIRRGAVTVDGVKRRVGAGLGRCQGGRCRLAIAALLEAYGYEQL